MVPLPSSVLEFQYFCQLKPLKTGGQSAAPLLFFTVLNNLHVLLGNLMGYTSFHSSFVIL